MNRALTLLRQPVYFGFAIGLGCTLISLLIAHFGKSYSSDDVFWQTALFTWQPFNGDMIYVGSDTFILKVPLYWLLNHLVEPGRLQLFITSALLAAANFTLFYYAAIYFLRKVQPRLSVVALLPIIWLTSFGYAFSILFLTPNLRNVEIGLMFVLYVVVAKYVHAEWRMRLSPLSALTVVGGGLLIGACMVNDMYFFYFGVLPCLALLVLLFWLYPRLRRRLVAPLLLLAVGVLSTPLVHHAVTAMGVTINESTPAHFIPFESLLGNSFTTLHSTLILFGADFFSRPALSIFTLIVLLQGAALGYMCYALVKRLRKPSVQRADDHLQTIWLVLFSLVAVEAIVLYTISTLAIGVSTYRYLIVLPFVGCLVLAAHMATAPKGEQRLAATLLALCIILGFAANVYAPGRFANQPLSAAQNHTTKQLIATLQASKATKGYAQYWNASITTYLSKGTVTTLPALCHEGQLMRQPWLVSQSQMQLATERSFIILDPRHPGLCSEPQLRKQFGNPLDRIMMEDTVILIYNGDIL